jgi:hypothetical protein
VSERSDIQKIDDLVQIAFRLGMAFGQTAEATDAVDRKLQLASLFDRCFFSVRVGIALKLRLGKVLSRPAAERAGEREALERERPEAPDHGEGGDDLRYDERDRDRETERASLPLLLRTLDGVAADAAALPGAPPAELPILRERLAQVRGAEPPPATRPPRPSANPARAPLRSRLSASTASLLAPPLSPTPARPPRRATGPP